MTLLASDSMLNKWDYSVVDEVCYSDEKQESYKKSAEFLGDTVEDWGCGTGWAKRYFTNYKGIDGSPGKYVDEVADLVYYTSNCDNILMREALEYNIEWENILDNVKKSFKKKFCLIISTPFIEETQITLTKDIEIADKTVEINEFSFKKQDILDFFPEKEYKVSEETIVTNHYYNQDWILYVERLSK